MARKPIVLGAIAAVGAVSVWFIATRAAMQEGGSAAAEKPAVQDADDRRWKAGPERHLGRRRWRRRRRQA